MANSTLVRGVLVFAASFLLSTTTHAQLFRAYVASDGNDANPCTLQQPCRLLPAALNAIVDGGEIWMLDSANFNTNSVAIGKSVSILAVPGAVGSVLAINGPAIGITAPALKVGLRNLVIGPFPGTVDAGVSMTGASTLTIENSLVANVTDGVKVLGGGTLRIANSIIRNSSNYAVFLADGASAEIAGTQMLGNVGGVKASAGLATSTTQASVTDSVISGGTWGVFAYTSVGGALARIYVTRCTIENTNSALQSQNLAGVLTGNPLVSVSASMIVRNNFAWYLQGTGSAIESSGNNHMSGNSNTSGLITTVGLQ